VSDVSVLRVVILKDRIASSSTFGIFNYNAVPKLDLLCLVILLRFHRRLQFRITITVLLLSSELRVSVHCTVVTRNYDLSLQNGTPCNTSGGDIFHRSERDFDLRAINRCVLTECDRVSR
jgi:hypothetical protein